MPAVAFERGGMCFNTLILSHPCFLMLLALLLDTGTRRRCQAVVRNLY